MRAEGRRYFFLECDFRGKQMTRNRSKVTGETRRKSVIIIVLLADELSLSWDWEFLRARVKHDQGVAFLDCQ